MPTPPLSDELCQEAVEARLQHGTLAAAAASLGIPRQTLQSRLQMSATRGFAPGHFDNGTAPGFTMGKVTIQRNASGEIERTWERQSPDAERAREAFEQAIADLCEGARGLAPATPAPAHTDSGSPPTMCE